ncbi:hypothetical protein DFA_07780 [Cavenderia fasciculata]|uniref:Ankyrin repeat-containing protein n=1 Tax=Cavenderia fasciculata TaxID=261658 RepID=F4Q3D3_CACFS|nr:uncharacterized protein DFA_07780 [Cavenderia fasciculata]EGG16802.1 hypothetical protein DFA_07780 [Cavenderia fasciculata]|eukprot:XP_004355276.1 hypothetical protein DFA_07780 [Cavenderia fasciculata]
MLLALLGTVSNIKISLSYSLTSILIRAIHIGYYIMISKARAGNGERKRGRRQRPQQQPPLGPLKGRDIIQLPCLAMISRYAMPWQFIRHYLPDQCLELKRRRLQVISEYCWHRNAKLETLKHLLEWSPDYEPNEAYMIYQIIQAGNLEIMTYILERYPSIGQRALSNAIDAACKLGDLTTLKLLNTFENADCSRYAMFNAVKNADFEMVKYLHQHRNDGCHHFPFSGQIKSNYLDILKFFHLNQEKYPKIFDSNVLDYAACNGFIDIVKFCHEHRKLDGATTKAMDEASCQGHIEILLFLHENRTEGASTDAIDRAAQNGFIESIKFLHENRSEGATFKAMDLAAKNGHMNILLYLHQNRSEGASSNAMDTAAERGYFEIVKFLHEHRTEGCSSGAIDQVVKTENMEILLYLVHTVKAQCTEAAVKTAIELGRLDILTLLHDHYAKCDIWSQRDMDLAAGLGNLEIVKFLGQHRSEGCTKKAIDRAATNGHFEMVQYLYQHRTEGASTRALDRAATNGHMEILQFLYQRRTEDASMDAMDGASKNGHFEIVKFLNDHEQGCISQSVSYACSGGNLEMVKYMADILKSRESLPEQLNQIFEESLVHAAEAGHIEVVKYILATFDIPTLHEMTILQLSRARDHYEIVDILKNRFPQLINKFN